MTSLLWSVADGWTRPIDTNSLTMMDQEWSITMAVISFTCQKILHLWSCFFIFWKEKLLNPNYKPKQETCLIADPWHKVMLGKTFRSGLGVSFLSKHNNTKSALSYTEPPKTKGFRVFKLECDIDAGPQWMEVVELGGRVLFVSNHHSAVYCTLWSKGRKKTIFILTLITRVMTQPDVTMEYFPSQIRVLGILVAPKVVLGRSCIPHLYGSYPIFDRLV
ncbi:hypothetical protein DVH24_042489 [Malus domestica]|uniref:DUF295 domain-containing protein n=1 Tax=Malus domestica TaxID=3750 RepID=A0A498HKQ7_MALDO|nr:hypothetical protein DVH24_042489 [Malus domestica]